MTEEFKLTPEEEILAAEALRAEDIKVIGSVQCLNLSNYIIEIQRFMTIAHCIAKVIDKRDQT
jgi:hypothetical protein